MDKPEYPPLLPAGFHKFELDELGAAFMLPFAHSRRRPLLVDGLTRFVATVSALGAVGELWFDGSFVSKKIDPEDIDLVVVLDEDAFWQLSVVRRSAIESALDNTVARIMYKCDVYWTFSSNLAEVSYWRGWFGFKRDGKTPKGIGFILL